ncbi:4927_t:CDS:2, partial [Scutellospora calospora]
NPESNTGVPITGIYRTPSPGSQPTTYIRPLTKHSDIAKNYYFDRDARRNYPRLATYTQTDVAKLIAVSHLKSDQEGSQESIPTEMTIPEKLDLTEAITSAPVLYSTEKLPPVPGNSLYRWKKSEDADDPDPGYIKFNAFKDLYQRNLI